MSNVAPVDQTDVDWRWGRSRSEGPCRFKTTSGIAITRRGRLGGSGLGFRLDCGGQAAASDRNGERAASHLSALPGLLRTITDDYGAEFVTHSDSLAYRTIGIYVFLRTVMCSPVRASQIAGSGLPARPSPLSGKCPGGKDFLLIRPRTRGQSLQRPRSSTLAC